MSVWGSANVGGVLVIGHRGGRGQGWPPENTMPAFERAREAGARAVELDVRTCAAGQVVVFHDASLARMTGGWDTRSVKDVPYEVLREIDLEGAQIPLLASALAWARQRQVAMNVELKHDVPSRLALAREAARLVKEAGGDVLFSSFDPSLLVMVAVFAPSVPRALLVHAGQGRWADAMQEAARPPYVSALHLQESQARAMALDRYARRGLRLGAWTVNDVGEAAELARSGVQSIITDRPGEMISAGL